MALTPRLGVTAGVHAPHGNASPEASDHQQDSSISAHSAGGGPPPLRPHPHSSGSPPTRKSNIQSHVKDFMDQSSLYWQTLASVTVPHLGQVLVLVPRLTRFLFDIRLVCEADVYRYTVVLT